jgi:hypothetical protein
MSDPIAEQALIDARAIACGVPVPLAPEAPFIVLVGAMFSPVHEVIEPCIEHGSQDI